MIIAVKIVLIFTIQDTLSDIKFKVIDENSKIVLSHIAPSLHKPHSETAEIAEKFGAIAAFDGMELSI